MVAYLGLVRNHCGLGRGMQTLIHQERMPLADCFGAGQLGYRSVAQFHNSEVRDRRALGRDKAIIHYRMFHVARPIAGQLVLGARGNPCWILAIGRHHP